MYNSYILKLLLFCNIIFHLKKKKDSYLNYGPNDTHLLAVDKKDDTTLLRFVKCVGFKKKKKKNIMVEEVTVKKDMNLIIEFIKMSKAKRQECHFLKHGIDCHFVN